MVGGTAVGVTVGDVCVGVMVCGTEVGVTVDRSGTDTTANGTEVDVAVGKKVGVAVGDNAKAIPGGTDSGAEVYESHNSSTRSGFVMAHTPRITKRSTAATATIPNQVPPLLAPEEWRREFRVLLLFLHRLYGFSDRN